MPGYPYAPPAPPAPPGRPQRRWWLIGIVTAWVAVLAGVALWSVRHDPPTVPEQRDIAQALPVLEQAAGAVLIAADSPERVVEVGALRMSRDCAVTPVRQGVEASRDIVVHVRADQASAALEAIAGLLPRGYQAEVTRIQDRPQYVLRADAGQFVAVRAVADADATVLTVRLTTGCRPPAPSAAASASAEGSAAPSAPGALAAALRALGAQPGTAVTNQVLGCAGGGAAITYVAGGLTAPADLGRAVQPLLDGATVVQADPHQWAYRVGAVSMVVAEADGHVRIAATTPCD
jgi:hypothetical protein